MDLSDALTVARGRTQAVLTTIKRDGKPQLSNVGHTVGDDGLIRVSITATRAKYHNLVRTPWAALHVNGADFWSYAVLECDAELTAVAQDPHDATADELVAVFTAIAGKEHPDWEEYRRAMVTDQRVVLRLRPQRAYGLLSES
ncbi:PPOX class F420-dependent oxidoreductase [Nocardioides nematodiphilus]|uniref:PPOX class F420-dependent oxidoreductase n=1 Tax=Nocardioides nematodiphilus TaxID=2849669 RepID=UPI001CDA349F|nr:PPOX class F420-dependent oxidoreductase [Nocardioides nematodiphilus]MCA1983587.1 PPOX class F420-dependent oxidoreductase [Nocardioides nematodiphilus]